MAESSSEPTADELSAQLKIYQDQLAAISECILIQSSSGGSDNDDLTELRELQNDLQQLVSLTEERLLETAKQRLLHSLNQGSVSCEDDTVLLTTTTTSSSNNDTPGEEEEESEDSLQGMKCQAPLNESWGTMTYHNAVILNRLQGGDEVEFDVTVLFTHPCFTNMRACPFFMEGRCKFDSDTCRYSHGFVVSFSKLKPYQEPNYSHLDVGSRCLVKQSDELWHEANICSIEGEDKVIVKFVTQNLEDQVTLEDILPLGDSSDDDDDDGNDSSSSAAEEEEKEVDDDLTIRQIEVSSFQVLSHGTSLGDWEQYTKGIGSKLMAKMGYVIGQGLGKSSDGRVEPVKIEILPAGKSLDACAELRENNKFREVGGVIKRKRNRGINKKKKLSKTEIKVKDTFEFLNKQVARTDTTTTSSDSMSSNREELKGNLNVKLFKIQEDIKNLSKKIVSLKQSVARNQGRDKIMAKQSSEKLTSAQKQMEDLKRQENRITAKLQHNTNKKKLAIF